jgi:hypothetical protein
MEQQTIQQDASIIFNSQTANFGEIEQKIVYYLTADTSTRAGLTNQESREHKQQNGQQVLSLCKVLQEKYKTRASMEYLTYLIRFYTGQNYTNTKKAISRFMESVNLRYKDLDTTNIYRTYKKLVFHRITDASANPEDNDIYAYEGVSFVKSLGRKTIHLI